MRNIAIFVVHVYRNTFSQFVLPSCRFVPSCSSYAEEAIRRHGFLRGAHLSLRRLLRCHPLSHGGVDQVP